MSLNVITVMFIIAVHIMTTYYMEQKQVKKNYKKILDLSGQTKRTLSNALGVPGAATLILPYARANLNLIRRIGIYEHRPNVTSFVKL